MDVYQMVTDRIIEQMQKGIVPWQKGWYNIMNGAFNRTTKKAYSLLNQLMLAHDGEYATFSQWSKLGGSIKKGEKSEMVVYWNMLTKTSILDDGTEIEEKIPVLKHYNVFHISQVEGVDPLTDEDKKGPTGTIASAEDIITKYVDKEHIKLRYEGDKAYYSPALDEIVCPPKECFFAGLEEFYSTVLHECVHSTGSKNRLDRLTGTVHFGSESYSKEELIAEIGSAMLCQVAGVETKKTFKNSVAYLQSWLEALQNDKRLIVSAAGKAEKAVKYILAAQEA